jgi:hypothetical protein
MSREGIQMKLKTWNTILDAAVALNLLTERFFWWARRHRDLYLDLQEADR